MPELEPTARRAAERAERAYSLLSSELVEPPRGRIELVIADNVDFANGYATLFPSNRIVVYAHPPADEPTLSFYDDWLQLVVLHELVHVFHLDHAGGIWEPLRSVFGRNPALFPQIFSPGWVSEGLATYFESLLTPAGRVRGSLYEMSLRTAVLEGGFFSIDRATADPATWPGASTRYIYGSLFVDHLAQVYGAQRIPELVEEVGGRLIPYRLDAAAREALGVSFSRAWSEWEDSLRVRYSALADSLADAGLTEPELLTDSGYYHVFPRYAPAGGALAYAASSGREESATRLILADGTHRTVTHRTTLGPSAWLPGGDDLLVSQIDYFDQFRLYAELYRVGLDGDQEQLTEGARVWEPDVHPDGRRAVAVTNADGTNALVVRDLATGEERLLAEPSLDQHWSLPRWSPDGGRIAAGRWRAGGFYDIVVLDAAGAVLRELTRDRAVDSAPAWSPDGRYVLFSSDRTGIPNLFAYDLRDDRLLQVTSVLSGAFQPDVSPDGAWIAFSYYRPDGYRIARIPFEPAAWRPAPPVRAEVVTPPVDPALYLATAGGPARRYSPWRTLAPTGWSAYFSAGTALGPGAGALVAGSDLVGRHLYGVQALAYADGGRVDAGASYRYQGWVNPLLDVSVRQGWGVDADEGALRDDAGRPIPSALLRREREAGAALSWRRPGWRSTSWLTLGGDLQDRDLAWDEPHAAGGVGLRQYPLDLGSMLEAGFSSTRGFAFSLGPQQGLLASARLEGHRYLEPFEGDDDPQGYVRLTGRGRGFRGFDAWGFAKHVLALRVDAGIEDGSRSPLFRVGGASGGGSPLGFDLDLFGGGVGFPVRGYGEAAQRGTHAVSGSLEYRFPLALVERGFRLVPLFVDRVWADAFLDAGTAWCPDRCTDRTRLSAALEPYPLASAGAELLTHFGVGYAGGFTLRAGFAFPLRDVAPPGAASFRPDPQLYLRFGRSF